MALDSKNDKSVVPQDHREMDERWRGVGSADVSPRYGVGNLTYLVPTRKNSHEARLGNAGVSASVHDLRPGG